MRKISYKPTYQNDTIVNVDNINSNVHKIIGILPQFPLSESFTNVLKNLSVDNENALNEKSKILKLILEIAKQVLTQNISIIEKQESIEATVTQLVNNVKTLQSSYENFKSNMKDHLISYKKLRPIKYEKGSFVLKKLDLEIQKELEAFCPNKMSYYKKNSK
ncbi:9176_t:CDS:2 [Gigaspora margarita]|uniref:9176_t:CDS:1 n=1 Tax=Gigaspora margarita TaxID=4874 RepID=A0ABM8W1Y5_GIGMA|nr:9176_t:CDS:2 [Gigaspora margarita]